MKLNKKRVASIGTLGIQTNSNKLDVLNTTLDPVKLSHYLSKLKKQKIENVILEASSHGLKQNRLDGLEFKTAIFTKINWIFFIFSFNKQFHSFYIFVEFYLLSRFFLNFRK